jgi:hypothetical protein
MSILNRPLAFSSICLQSDRTQALLYFVGDWSIRLLSQWGQIVSLSPCFHYVVRPLLLLLLQRQLLLTGLSRTKINFLKFPACFRFLGSQHPSARRFVGGRDRCRLGPWSFDQRKLWPMRPRVHGGHMTEKFENAPRACTVLRVCSKRITLRIFGIACTNTKWLSTRKYVFNCSRRLLL